MTQTGDSDERVNNSGKDETQIRAYFPSVGDANEAGDIDAPAGGSYTWQDLDDQTHVRFEGAGTRGWNSPTALPSGIAIVGVPVSAPPKRTVSVGKSDVFTAFKHEVQHAADRSHDKSSAIGQRLDLFINQVEAAERLDDALKMRQPLDDKDLALVPESFRTLIKDIHRTVEDGGKVTGAQVEAVNQERGHVRAVKLRLTGLTYLELYKTEYRAYSYQGTYRALDNSVNYDAHVPSALHIGGHHWTERQYAIFSQIHAGYEHTRLGWANDPPVFGSEHQFREAVLAYRDPDTEGVNRLDSPRVNRFFEQLVALPAGTADPRTRAMNDLVETVRTLNRAEAIYVRNASGAPRENTMAMDLRLKDAALRRVIAMLDNAAHS